MDKKNQERKSLKLMIKRVRVSVGIRAGTSDPSPSWTDIGNLSGSPPSSSAAPLSISY
jgi:hypothetical protein